MDSRCSKEYIILDVVPIIAFMVAVLLFRKCIPDVAYLRYIYLGGMIIMGIAAIIKLAVNVTRILQKETPKNLDDAFRLVMGPGVLALLVASFYSIFQDNDVLFNVYGKSPQVYLFLLFFLFMAGRVFYVWRLQKKQIKTLGNLTLKIFDCAAMISLLIFTILASASISA